ncbi:MAG: VWA domain-containing protein [Nannocystis sp.]|nr:hypothetical protein [Nannocystis sp.]MBA3547302.1 VWA domain-containing protein [Nannocystis sp.]
MGLSVGLLGACSDPSNDDDSGVTTTGLTGGISLANPTTSDSEAVSITNDPTLGWLDLPSNDSEALPDCNADGTCNLLDILFVIDNSGSMGEEQKNLAQNFPYLIEKIRALTDKKGNAVNADVNIMVTTSDFGHPLCTPYYKPDYTPAKGAPINTACTDRIERFTGVGPNAPVIPEACTAGCTPGAAATPNGPYIHFNPDDSNVVGFDGVGDPVADALACIGPQGIDGCGMEADLETMLQALDPGKSWNQGDTPFLRTGAVLAIIMVTDEEDCATKDYRYFDPANKSDPALNQYWEDLPGMPGVKGSPTSAVCWNAGTDCTDANADGIYESCMSADNGVLQPISRYVNYLKKELVEKRNKQVIMLGILGVPPVTDHNPLPPFEPTAGGVKTLVYRDWLPSDILPGDTKTAADKQYDFGIGPGCSNAATGQAVPPVRIKEVCESLNVPDDPNMGGDQAKLRCCIESICDTDFSAAINCLAGILQEELTPQG